MVQVISIILDKISVYLDLMAMEILDQLIIETIVVAIRIGKDRTEEATKEEEVIEVLLEVKEVIMLKMAMQIMVARDSHMVRTKISMVIILFMDS